RALTAEPIAHEDGPRRAGGRRGSYIDPRPARPGGAGQPTARSSAPRTRTTISGEKSNMPVRGSSLRTGASNGSVVELMNPATAPRPVGFTKETATRA